MATQDFRVYISGGTVTLDDWRQAMSAGEEDLPKLDEAQKEAARFVKMSEPEYARGVLADEIGSKRQQERGKRLGEAIGDILKRTGKPWILDSLVRRGTEGRWIARFTSDDRGAEVEIPIELADDVMDSNDRYPLVKLEELLKGRLGTASDQVHQ